jgi:hypothetical protein
MDPNPHARRTVAVLLRFSVAQPHQWRPRGADPQTTPYSQRAKVNARVLAAARLASGATSSAATPRGLFRRLEKLGWKVADRREMLDRVPADNELLVRELRTSAGRKFMRQMDRYPDAYDRLDRLTHMPQGTSTLKRLVAGPDGYKLIEYLTTASGGREMGKMLSDTPRGRGFNRSTDRIYTQQLLMESLKRSYKEAGGKIPADVERHEQAETAW